MIIDDTLAFIANAIKEKKPFYVNGTVVAWRVCDGSNLASLEGGCPIVHNLSCIWLNSLVSHITCPAATDGSADPGDVQIYWNSELALF